MAGEDSRARWPEKTGPPRSARWPEKTGPLRSARWWPEKTKARGGGRRRSEGAQRRPEKTKGLRRVRARYQAGGKTKAL